MNKLICQNCEKDALCCESETIMSDKAKGGKLISIVWLCMMCRFKTVEVRPLPSHPDYGTRAPAFYLIKYIFDAEPPDIKMKGHWDA